MILSLSGCYVSTPFYTDDFNSYIGGLKKKYDYVKTAKMEIGPGGCIILEIITKRDLNWEEAKELFINDIKPFMTGESMMKSIKEQWGDDSLNHYYPQMYVELFSNNYKSWSLQFGSSYYNTFDRFDLIKENITGYSRWGVSDGYEKDKEILPKNFKGFDFNQKNPLDVPPEANDKEIQGSFYKITKVTFNEGKYRNILPSY